jgi:hypothetical protein
VTAYFDEQRRKQAEARVHFFWLLVIWASKEKVTRCESEKEW